MARSLQRMKPLLKGQYECQQLTIPANIISLWRRECFRNKTADYNFALTVSLSQVYSSSYRGYIHLLIERSRRMRVMQKLSSILNAEGVFGWGCQIPGVVTLL